MSRDNLVQAWVGYSARLLRDRSFETFAAVMSCLLREGYSGFKVKGDRNSTRSGSFLPIQTR